MPKLTKQQFTDVVACVQKDIDAYVAKTKRVFTEEGKVEELQYDDIVHVYKALTAFALTKNLQQLIEQLMWQDTFVREQFLSALRYCDDAEIAYYY